MSAPVFTQAWVKGRLRSDVGITSGLPRIAAHLLQAQLGSVGQGAVSISPRLAGAA